MHPEFAELTERLRRLESRQTWLNRGLIVGTVTLMVVVIAGAAALQAPKSVAAKSFEVVDDNGKRLAYLGPHPDQPGVALILYDQGQGRLIAAANPQDASVSLIESGELRATLNARKGKHVGLLLQKEKFDDKRNQMGFFYMDDGKPAIFVNDENAKSIVLLPQP